MKDDFVASGRSVSDLKAHLVLTTKYRRKVLTGEMRDRFISNLKSISSRRLRSEFPARVNQFYSHAVFWNESYFIASCGGVTVSVLKRYIEKQNSPDERN